MSSHRQDTTNQQTELLIKVDTLVHQLHSEGIIPSFQNHYRDISSGLNSAVVCIDTPHGQIIVKFRSPNGNAEVSAMNMWKQAEVKVPTIEAYGTIGDTEYIIMKAVTDTKGNLAQTAKDMPHLDKTKINAFLAHQLANMHKEKFSHFGAVSNPRFDSWNAYIHTELDSFKQNASFSKLGYTQADVDILYKIGTVTYATSPSLCNGDFGEHNTLITHIDPIMGVCIDPEPLFGDSYYDLALYLNGKTVWTGQEVQPSEDIFIKHYCHNMNENHLDPLRMIGMRSFAALKKAFVMADRCDTKKSQAYAQIALKQASLLE